MKLKQQHMHTALTQKGGTILGLIIGVLVGLGAALAVAVYVTKVPVPFVNKGSQKGSSSEQDAAEAQKNKNWDPNAPLYGKGAAKPGAGASGAVGAVGAAPGASPTPAAPPDAAPAAAPPSKPAVAASAAAPKVAAAKPATSAPAPAAPAPAAPVAAAPKPASADPLGDLAKAKGAATSTTGNADPFTYLVQAGAFRTPEDAEAQRVKLGLLGMDAKVTEREQSGRTVFRVRVGPYNTKEEAERSKEKLEGGGFETALVRVQR